MKTGACYIRVSTNDQLEYSPDSQLEKIMDYAKKNDIIIPSEYIFIEKEGVSARKVKKRQQFQRMIGIAKTKPKPFDVIIVWKFSRFARNREDSIVYKSMLRKQLDIDVVSVSESLGDDKMSILVEALIEAMDEYYSINLGEEVKRGMLERVSKGGAVSIPPFGYDIKDKKYVPNDYADVVKMIFNSFLSGNGCLAIAKQLNAMGYRTRRGNNWENRTVEYILQNPVYTGKIRWNPERRTYRNYNDEDIVIVDGEHEPIVSTVTFNAVQEKLKEQKMKYSRYSRVREFNNYILQGIVRCSSCGGTLTMCSSGTSLQCYRYSHGQCNTSHNISIKKLDSIAISAIEAAFGSKSIELTARQGSSINSFDIQSIKKQIEKEKIKLGRIKDAYEEAVYSLEEYTERCSKVNTKIKYLNNKLEPVSAVDSKTQKKQLINYYLPIIDILKNQSINPTEKNNLIREFIVSFIFDRTACSVILVFG